MSQRRYRIYRFLGGTGNLLFLLIILFLSCYLTLRLQERELKVVEQRKAIKQLKEDNAVLRKHKLIGAKTCRLPKNTMKNN
jgi:hypothetical protein